MTEVRKGQVVALPEGIGTVRLIHREVLEGLPEAELSATIHVEMLDGSEVLVDRSRFAEIKLVRPVYGRQAELIGYTIDGQGLMAADQLEQLKRLEARP